MKNYLTIIFLFILTIFTQNIQATGQYPDKIFIDGIEYIFKGNPLEPYFEKYPEKKPKTNITSSALHRGYIATFNLINDKLYLIDIKINIKKENSGKSLKTEMISVFNKVFPNEDKILMDLYSGVLIVHIDLEESYKNRNRLLIEVQDGIEHERRIYGNEKYKEFMDEQFELYKKTKKYKSEFLELMKDEEDNEKYFENEQQKKQFMENLIRTYTPNFTSKLID
ncbi:hypothetical protein [Aquimarina sp. AU119]|uniref:hypothetical protein n=1 Tax=Aquimarina sp. AU119 TaxID=2108528 RepID=UPI000D69E49C|nr:hypothetical protein [Aquimarina sp. AU119]